MHTMPTGNIPEAPEFGIPHYKGQNVGSHWCLLWRGSTVYHWIENQFPLCSVASFPGPAQLSIACSTVKQNMSMGDEFKWLFKEGGGGIFKGCEIFLENTTTSHILVASPCCDFVMPFFVIWLLMLSLLVPPLQSTASTMLFVEHNSMYYSVNRCTLVRNAPFVIVHS